LLASVSRWFSNDDLTLHVLIAIAFHANQLYILLQGVPIKTIP